MPWKEGVKVFCQVIVDIVHENVAKPFTYQIPDGMELMAGQRVAVPFGHMEKEGIVTALTTDTDVSPAKLRSVIRPLEEYAAIPPELIELAEDMALKSHCPLAETLRLMIPAQMRGGRVHIKTEKTVCLCVSREDAETAAAACTRSLKRNAILNLLKDGQPRTVHEISEHVRDPRDALKKLEADGLVKITDAEKLRMPGGSVPEVYSGTRKGKGNVPASRSDGKRKDGGFYGCCPKCPVIREKRNYPCSGNCTDAPDGFLVQGTFRPGGCGDPFPAERRRTI